FRRCGRAGCRGHARRGCVVGVPSPRSGRTRWWRPSGGVLAGGGGQLALLADRDQPVRACGAEIVDAEVAGIGEQHPDPGGWRGGGPVRVDQAAAAMALPIISVNAVASLELLPTEVAMMSPSL